jgi:PAS domain S-box-containing protein
VNRSAARRRAARAIRPLTPILIAFSFVGPALLITALAADGMTAALAIVASGLLTACSSLLLLQREVTRGRAVLAASIKLYRRLFNEAYDAVLIADAAGGAVLDANRAACRMFGYTREEMRRLRLRHLQPDGGEDHLTAAGGAEPLPGRRDLEGITCVRKGGERFQADLRGGTILVNGRPFAAWVLRDAGEQGGLQEQRRRAERMESVANVAGGFAHGFNNHLTGIMGYTRLILDRLSPDEMIRRPLTSIEKSAAQAAELAGELMTFSRRADIRPVPDDLNRVVREIVESLRHALPPGIAVELRGAPDLMTSAFDAERIRRAIRHLCANACEAMPGGGRLVITTANRTLTQDDCRSNIEARPGQFVTLTVSDSGEGIPPEARGRLFEPFFSTRKRGDGAGLGLATVYGTVKSHDGWVDVETAPGKGSSFVVHLPAWNVVAAPAPAERDAGGARDAIAVDPAGATILVVDDESTVLALARDVLELHRYRVVTARNGEEALRRFREDPGAIDLVLLDLTMPGMGGEECFRQMRTIDPGVRVVISSGFSSQSSASQILRDGALDFLHKPFDIDALARAVQRALRRTPRIPTAAAG